MLGTRPDGSSFVLLLERGTEHVPFILDDLAQAVEHAIVGLLTGSSSRLQLTAGEDGWLDTSRSCAGRIGNNASG